MCPLMGMSTQDYARKRAVELAETDPSSAFDLLLASDGLDKAAAKSPKMVALNRSMRKIRTEGVKYLSQRVKDLIWEPSKGVREDFGSSVVSFYGKPDADGRGLIRVELDIHERPEHQPPEGYDCTIYVYGKSNREIAAYRATELTLDDFKKSIGPKVLDKAVKSVANHLSGSMDEERARLMEYVKTAIEAGSKVMPALKDVEKAVKGSKNLVADAEDIRRLMSAVPSVDPQMRMARDFLERIIRAGG